MNALILLLTNISPILGDDSISRCIGLDFRVFGSTLNVYSLKKKLFKGPTLLMLPEQNISVKLQKQNEWKQHLKIPELNNIEFIFYYIHIMIQQVIV